MGPVRLNNAQLRFFYVDILLDYRNLPLTWNAIHFTEEGTLLIPLDKRDFGLNDTPVMFENHVFDPYRSPTIFVRSGYPPLPKFSKSWTNAKKSEKFT